MCTNSESVLLKLLLGGDALLHEELGHLVPAVSLQLDDLAPLLVVDDSSIAVPDLLEVAIQLLEVQVLW